MQCCPVTKQCCTTQLETTTKIINILFNQYHLFDSVEAGVIIIGGKMKFHEALTLVLFF